VTNRKLVEIPGFCLKKHLLVLEKTNCYIRPGNMARKCFSDGISTVLMSLLLTLKSEKHGLLKAK